jgi:hypothetical protein
MEEETVCFKCFCIKGIHYSVSDRDLLALQKYQDMLQCGLYMRIPRLSRDLNTI